MRLSRKKRPLRLIRAFAEAVRFVAGAPRMRLIVAGAGPDAESMLRLANELGVGDRVELAGQLSRDELGRSTGERTSSFCRASASRSAWRRSRLVRPACRWSRCRRAGCVTSSARESTACWRATTPSSRSSCRAWHSTFHSGIRCSFGERRSSTVRLVRRTGDTPRDVRARGAARRLDAVGGADQREAPAQSTPGAASAEEVAEVLERGETDGLLGGDPEAPICEDDGSSYTPMLPGTIGSSVERLSIASASTAAPMGRSRPKARCMQTIAPTSTAFFTSASASAPPPRRGSAAAPALSEARRVIARSRSRMEPARPLLAAPIGSACDPARQTPRDAPGTRRTSSTATDRDLQSERARATHSGNKDDDRPAVGGTPLSDADSD